jgi:hypothetical protein
MSTKVDFQVVYNVLMYLGNVLTECAVQMQAKKSASAFNYVNEAITRRLVIKDHRCHEHSCFNEKDEEIRRKEMSSGKGKFIVGCVLTN